MVGFSNHYGRGRVSWSVPGIQDAFCWILGSPPLCPVQSFLPHKTSSKTSPACPATADLLGNNFVSSLTLKQAITVIDGSLASSSFLLSHTHAATAVVLHPGPAAATKRYFPKRKESPDFSALCLLPTELYDSSYATTSAAANFTATQSEL